MVKCNESALLFVMLFQMYYDLIWRKMVLQLSLRLQGETSDKDFFHVNLITSNLFSF